MGGRLASLGKPSGPGGRHCRAGGRHSRVIGHGLTACEVTAVDAANGGIDLADDPGKRDDVEDTLAAPQQVDDLLTRAHQHRALADHDEVRRREVFSDGFAQAFDRASGLAQVHAAIEKLLDHLQLEQVLVGVQPLGPTATRLGERRAAEAGPVPVVQLAICDTDDAAHLRPAETDLVHFVPLSLVPVLPPLPSNGPQRGSYTFVRKVTARVTRRQ